MRNDTAKALEESCPVDETISIISGKWKASILFHVCKGPHRFNALRRLMPKVTQKMLTQHLRELERDGIILRDVHAQVPPHVEYSLTQKGETLVPILLAMAEWGHQHRTSSESSSDV